MGRKPNPFAAITELRDAPPTTSNTRRGTKRPNNRPPSNRYGSRKRELNELGSEQPSGVPTGSSISYGERIQRHAEAKKERVEPSMRQRIMAYPLEQKWAAEKAEMEINHLLERVWAVAEAQHSCPEWTQEEPGLKPISTKPVCYISFCLMRNIEIPLYGCEGCGVIVSVEPEDVGCSPQTFKNPGTWYDNSYVEQCKSLNLEGGVSSDVMCRTHHRLVTLYDPEAAQQVDPRGNTYTMKLRASQLNETLLFNGVVWSAAKNFLEPQQAALDIFKGCPKCADAGRSKLDDGVTDVPDERDYIIVADGDAMTKACRFKNVGTAQAGVEPLLDSFIGDTNTKVRTLYEQGILVSAAQERVRLEQEAEEEGGGLSTVDSCNVALRCARPSAAARGDILDQTGMVGICCSHMVPVLGCFVSMWTPEQFSYYEHILRHLLTYKPTIQMFNIDVGCRLDGRFHGILEKGIEEGAFSARARDIILSVPYMHGSQHGMECKLAYCAMYKPGTGWRDGEDMERLWAWLKPLVRNTRYMSSAHYQDALNLALELLVVIKQDTIVTSSLRRHNTLKQKYAAAEKELSSLLIEAAEHEVTDFPAAVAAVVEFERSGGVAALTDAAKYVEVLLLLEARSTLAGRKTGNTLLFSGSLAAKIHKKGSDSSFREKQEKKRDQLAVKLGVLPNQAHWQPGEDAYSAAFAFLQIHHVAKLEQQVEEAVFRRNLVHLEKERESGNAALKLGKKMASMCEDISDLLDMRHSWLSEGTTVEVPRPDLNEVCSGTFAWREASAPERTTAGPTLTALRYFGRRYRTLAARHDRLAEEKNRFFPMEVVRSLNWLELRVAASRAGALNAAQQAQEGITAGNRAEAALQRGLRAMWKTEENRVSLLLEEARRKLLPLISVGAGLAEGDAAQSGSGADLNSTADG